MHGLIRSSELLLIVLVVAAGCSGRGGDRRGGGGGGDRDGGSSSGDGAIADGGGTTGDDGASGGDDCIDEARWIYLLDSSEQLVRFEPDSMTLTVVGTLDCPVSGTPFSMSVDRNATAWVLYDDGRIYHASTTDAACTATSFAPNQAGFERFGMGFVSDAAGSDAETLFVGGGSSFGIGTGSSQLGFIDPASLVLSPVGSLPGWPELTGTGSAELWAFFPDTRPPSVRRIDKSTAATSETYDLDALGSVSPSAWAFAFWGGRFYVFLQDLLDPSTNVWRLDPETGSFTEVIPDSGYRIVGAGVSTCAPVDLI